jgi:hypothetical protein
MQLELLREILFSQYRQRIAEMQAELDGLHKRIDDPDALTRTVTPIVGEAIRRKTRESRDEMVEALYPLIGQLVVRAVSEAIRDLARQIDARLRTSFDVAVAWRRLRSRLLGVSAAELALRDALPFAVLEVFLIHRETGLLLRHLSVQEHGAEENADLISGMLTAIRDFAAQAFGQGQEGSLDEIQYGQRRILVEAAQHAYLAVVVDGIEPAGYRSELRDRVVTIENSFDQVLRHYSGDPASLSNVDDSLRPLFRTSGDLHEL